MPPLAPATTCSLHTGAYAHKPIFLLTSSFLRFYLNLYNLFLPLAIEI